MSIQTVIIRLAFRKGSNEIHVGLTKQGNKTFIGEIVYSEDLVVSHYNKLVDVSSQSVEGNVGTICIADDEEADLLIEQIETIQANRSVNDRGNKYPFVFIRVMTVGLIIYNKSNGEDPDRLTFLDVELIAENTGATIILNYEIVMYYGAKNLKGHPVNHGGTFKTDAFAAKYVNAIHKNAIYCFYCIVSI